MNPQTIIEKSNKYLVRVSCMTYNHSSFILDAMKGFVMQQTNFPFICTIIDDASTDGAQKVINHYVRENFDLQNSTNASDKDTDYGHVTFARHKTNVNCFFAVIYLKENHYSQRKSKGVYLLKEWLPTKYCALCEGDDYWTDSLKLQKQVDYLEAHPECGLVYTQARQYIQETGEFIDGWAAQTDFEDLLLNANKIMTLCTLFRNDLSQDYYEWRGTNCNWIMGDFPLWLYLSKHSKIHYIDEVTGVYRLLESSASHDSDIEKMKNFLISTYEVRCYFAKRYGYHHLLNQFAKNEVDNLFRQSVHKDKSISKFIFQFAREKGVLSWEIVVKCLLYSTKLGRLYHRKKYPDSV